MKRFSDICELLCPRGWSFYSLVAPSPLPPFPFLLSFPYCTRFPCARKRKRLEKKIEIENKWFRKNRVNIFSMENSVPRVL